jgi:ATP synthase protein I
VIPTPAASRARPDEAQLRRLLLLQLVFTVLAGFAALPFGSLTLVSVMIGAGVCLLANLIFALWAFRSYRAARPDALLLRLYGAEIFKVVLILSLFSAAFVTIDHLNLPALLGGYFVVQVMPALFASRPDARSTAEK